MPAIVVFSDVFLPNSVVAAGVRGKNMRLNSRVETENGRQAVNTIWTQTLRQFEIGFIPMRVDQWQAIETLHEITEGGAFGILMEDPKDREATTGVMTQLGPSTYQLHKRYVDPVSTRFKNRKITRPNPVGFVPRLAGVPMAPADYLLDDQSGVFTVTGTPPAASALSWTGRFFVPVHFMDDSIDWTMLRSGDHASRYLAGPSVMLQEIRE
jgi:uncharacterized protein (TIGR02217 family)